MPSYTPWRPCDEHLVGLERDRETNPLLGRQADCRFVTAYVSGHLDVALSSIIEDGLLDGIENLVSPEVRRKNCVGFELCIKVLTITGLPLPLNINDHYPHEARPKN